MPLNRSDKSWHCPFLNSHEMRSSAIFIFEGSFDVWSIFFFFFSLRLHSVVNERRNVSWMFLFDKREYYILTLCGEIISCLRLLIDREYIFYFVKRDYEIRRLSIVGIKENVYCFVNIVLINLIELNFIYL